MASLSEISSYFGLAHKESLSTLVAKKFVAARESSDLIFSSTHLSIIQCNGIPFQLRYCPALSQKPSVQKTPLSPTLGIAAKKSNPFANPSSRLLIQRIPHDADHPTHNLLLNKYPVIPEHIILATIDYKSQTDLLEAVDLDATWRVLEAWETEKGEEGEEKRLFAFFNSGVFSGASQGHRHLQFLPVEEIKAQATEESDWKGIPASEWRPLIDVLGSAGPNVNLPFQCFHASLEGEVTKEQLFHTYSSLYHKATEAVNRYRQQQGITSSVASDGTPRAASEVSYNLAMTTNRMAICPRWREHLDIRASSNGESWKEGVVIGKVEVNGTLLAGTLTVKTEKEWNHLRRNEDEKPLKQLLGAIGIPGATEERQAHEHL